MYNTKQAAKIVGVSTRTLLYMVRDGKIKPSVKFKRAFGYTQSDLDAYLKNKVEKIEDAYLHGNLKKTLIENGIDTVSKLRALDRIDLLKIHGISKTFLKQIDKLLENGN